VERTGLDLDMEIVARGALFHELGKAKTHAMEGIAKMKKL